DRSGNRPTAARSLDRRFRQPGRHCGTRRGREHSSEQARPEGCTAAREAKAEEFFPAFQSPTKGTEAPAKLLRRLVLGLLAEEASDERIAVLFGKPGQLLVEHAEQVVKVAFRSEERRV